MTDTIQFKIIADTLEIKGRRLSGNTKLRFMSRTEKGGWGVDGEAVMPNDLATEFLRGIDIMIIAVEDFREATTDD